MTELHIGRSWTGHPLEDECPCPQAECGLISQSQALDDCPQHSFMAARTIRQGHKADECPGPIPKYIPGKLATE